jgi:uncharacterized membrane protein
MATVANTDRPMTTMTKSASRIQSLDLDLLRGGVMVIMAIDHIRDFLHYDAQHFSPEDLAHTNAAIFFTRGSRHFAPVFVFLANRRLPVARRRQASADVSRLLWTAACG